MSEPEGAGPPAVTPETPRAPKTVGEAFAQMTLPTAALLGGAGLVAIGSIGPWVTSPLASASGTSGDGVFTLIGAVLIVGATLFTTGRRLLLALILIVGAIGIYDFVHEHDKVRSVTLDGLQIYHVGWGLYLVVIGAVIALAGLVKRAPETPRVSLLSDQSPRE